MNIEATYGSDGVLIVRFYSVDGTFEVELAPTAAAKLLKEVRREIEKGFSVNERKALGL